MSSVGNGSAVIRSTYEQRSLIEGLELLIRTVLDRWSYYAYFFTNLIRTVFILVSI
jgi:hypothetical protein